MFWPLLLVAFIGTLNPSSGDVSVFLPLEHARLANASQGGERTSLFARYSLVGSLFAAIGSLATAVPQWLEGMGGLSSLDALRAMFLLYGAIGGLIWLMYRRLPTPPLEAERKPQRLGKSRAVVWRLAALFSVDSFAGGLAVNALLALWLFERFIFHWRRPGCSFSGPVCVRCSRNLPHRYWQSASVYSILTLWQSFKSHEMNIHAIEK